MWRVRIRCAHDKKAASRKASGLPTNIVGRPELQVLRFPSFGGGGAEATLIASTQERSFAERRKPAQDHERTLKSDPSHAPFDSQGKQGKRVGHSQNQKQIPRAAALVMTASKKATAGLLEV
jgi:hypothetical protein